MARTDRSCMTFYWSAIVTIALSYTVFELIDVEKHRSLTLNISQMATNTAIVTIEGE